MSFTRLCPNCKKEITYTNKGNMAAAEKAGRICCACNGKRNGIRNKGVNNPFYGRTHSDEQKEKWRERNLKNIDIYRTEEFRAKIAKISKDRPPPKDLKKFWTEKYGLEEAERRYKELNLKKSKNTKGKNNPMYGKPAPTGAGNGWKGWYKEHYFRSLRELMYMIQLDEQNIVWSTGEKISIEYVDWQGTDRTYRPDFIVNNDTVVEIKPTKLFKSPQVQTKLKALIEYAATNSLKYELIDIKIDSDKIQECLDKDLIKFAKGYQEKFELWLKK